MLKKESRSVFDLYFFSYLSILMEKYWLRTWKAFFDAVDAGWPMKGREKPSFPIVSVLLDSNVEDGSNR